MIHLQIPENMKFIYCIILLIGVTISNAQVINISGASASGVGTTMANDYLVPVPGAPGILTFDADTCILGNFIAGLYGNDYATYCFAHSLETGENPQHHEVSSYFGSRAIINGDNSQTVQIKWKNTGANYATTDEHRARIITSLNFNVNMSVTGIPAGTNVTIYWWYDIFGGGNTSHEDLVLLEDSIRVRNTMTVNGTSQFNSQFDFGSPLGLPGWNEWKNRTGTFQVTAGANFNFSVTSALFLYLKDPGQPGGFGFPVDQNDGIFKGTIYFTLLAQYPIIVNNDDMLPLFSLDIGSDSELSDPQQNGNEVFDPGDMYPMSNAGPVPFVTPWKDDSLIFAHDPDPKPFAPVNPAPVGSGQPIDLVRGTYFDLDGSDLLDFSLYGSGINYGPGDPSIAWFSDSCIYEAEYLFVSFDDDTPEHFTSVVPASVPVNSNSPGFDTIYSDYGNQNEVREYDFDPTPASGAYFQNNLYAESDLHSNLFPDPLGNNDFDDDVDALDMIPIIGNYTPCSVWYFSADHEASYNHPNFGAAYLDPAIVYEVTPAGPVPVVTLFNTGLQIGTDMDDFEFAWVWDQLEGRYGLALLFTVNDDDTITSEDETGGLNPRMIYYSFLNGTSQPFSANQFNDDVDGLTVWQNSLNGTIPFPTPVWGSKTWTGSIDQNWKNALNWFPQGVPFNPENVTIPAVLPSPVIKNSGLDCKSVNIQAGGELRLLNGATLSIKGL
jgi:hypothetical protein